MLKLDSFYVNDGIVGEWLDEVSPTAIVPREEIWVSMAVLVHSVEDRLLGSQRVSL